MELIHHQARENTATAHVMSPVREHMLPKMKTTTAANRNDMLQQADWLRHNQSPRPKKKKKENQLFEHSQR